MSSLSPPTLSPPSSDLPANLYVVLDGIYSGVITAGPSLQRSVEELQTIRSQQSECQNWIQELLHGVWGREERQELMQEDVRMVK